MFKRKNLVKKSFNKWDGSYYCLPSQKKSEIKKKEEKLFNSNISLSKDNLQVSFQFKENKKTFFLIKKKKYFHARKHQPI